MTDLYAVFGHPIAHSKSPLIHAFFARQTGQDMGYEAILAPLGGFEKSLKDFIARGGRGGNVTLPFKEDAWRLMDVRSQRAEAAGAVNTWLIGKDGRLYGDNTDGIGLVRDLTQRHAVRLCDARVLILGAGGAVRGVLEPILAQRPKEVVIVNRTAAKADALARQFASAANLSGGGYSLFEDKSFNLIINGTSASLSGELPPLPAQVLAEGAVCYDMMYSREQTVFLRFAAEQGAALCLDGLGMLVEQAAEAFFLWRGVRPDTAPVLAELRRAL